MFGAQPPRIWFSAVPRVCHFRLRSMIAHYKRAQAEERGLCAGTKNAE
jgi:hypothetical protein